MALGVILLLLFIMLILSDATQAVARASFLVFIAGIGVLAAGAVLYGIARVPKS